MGARQQRTGPLALAVLILGIAVPAANASTITVDTTRDGFGVNGRCGLRDAIQAAQTEAASGGCTAGSGGDVVSLPAGHFELTLAGAGEDANHTGDLDLTSGGGAVTIQGAGSDLTTIDARGIDRVIDVLPSAKVTIDGVEITGGHAPDGAPEAAGEDGGGLKNSASLTLRDSIVDDNVAGNGGAGAPGPPPFAPPFMGGSGGSSTGGTGGSGGFGGGVFNNGGLVVERTRVANNRAGAGGSGGASPSGADAYGGPSGMVAGNGGNSTGGPGGLGGVGGGIFASLGLHMSDSTVVANRSGAGGPGGSSGFAGDGAGTGGSGSSSGGTGGHGGGGGAIVAGAGSTIDRSTVTANETGAGGTGGHAGTGGTNIAGAGQAPGGAGGAAGSGAGLSGSPIATNVTITANHAGAGGAGGAGGTGGADLGGHAAANGGNGGAGGAAGGADGVALVNATLVGNAAGAGGVGGAAGTSPGGAGATGATGVGAAARDGSLKNSITASNGASGCAPAALPADNGGNITFQSGTACPGTAADPGLGALADNGGATATMAPALPGPAIDAGVASGCPATDQRGVPRPIGAACDAGAYEAGVTATTGDATASLDSAALPGTLTPTLRPTSFHFEYGTTTAYGSTTPVVQAASGSGPTAVGVTIAGLAPSTTYHYRLVAVSPDSAVAFTGADKTFTTADAPAAPIQQQQQQPSDQGQTPTTTPPVTTPPPTVPAVRGMAFVADSGAALVRLDKRGRFKLPGLSFSCPKDASGKCTAKISIAGGTSGTLSVAPGKAGTATLKAAKKLVAKAKKQGYVVLTAKVTFAAPGSNPVSVKKSFVLLKRR